MSNLALALAFALEMILHLQGIEVGEEFFLLWLGSSDVIFEMH